MFEMNAKIGPKIFMLKRMAVDLFFFLFLLMVMGLTVFIELLVCNVFTQANRDLLDLRCVMYKCSCEISER